MRKLYVRHTKKEPYKGVGAEELGAFIRSLQQQNYSLKTIDIRQRAIRDLLVYLGNQGHDRLADIQLSDLEGYHKHIMERGFNINSVNGYLWSVKRLFDFLDENRIIFDNPAKGLFIPRPRRDMQPVPSQPEMQRLLSMPDTSTVFGVRDRALLEVLYTTGARQGELLGMKLTDMDIERGRVRIVGKGSKERIVPLGQHAKFWLKKYIMEARETLTAGKEYTPRLWISKDGLPISGVRVDMIIRGYVAQAGIKKPISTHSLRRACATHMLLNGAHPLQLQMLLGHASFKSLSQYLHVDMKEIIKTHHRTRPGQ